MELAQSKLKILQKGGGGRRLTVAAAAQPQAQGGGEDSLGKDSHPVNEASLASPIVYWQESHGVLYYELSSEKPRKYNLLP